MGVLHQDNKQRAFLSLIGRCSPRAKAVDLNEVLAPCHRHPQPASRCDESARSEAGGKTYVTQHMVMPERGSKL